MLPRRTLTDGVIALRPWRVEDADWYVAQVAERAGLRRERVQRAARVVKGERWDVVWYGLSLPARVAGRLKTGGVGYMSRMIRRPALVAAWLWAIVVALWVGRASYAVLRFLGPDVVFGALVLVAAVGAAVWIRRRGLPVRDARTVTEKASVGS